MKSTKRVLMSVVVTALLFSSYQSEAKSNYSNKAVGAEDKIKSKVAHHYLPTVFGEELPVFASRVSQSMMDKYTPEQLNKLIGVWPDRNGSSFVPAVGAGEQVEVTPLTNGETGYSPEQLVNILGLTF